MGKKASLSAWCLVPRKIVRGFVKYAEYNPDNKTLTAFLKSVEKSPPFKNGKAKKENHSKQGQKRKLKQADTEEIHSRKNIQGESSRKKKPKTERNIEPESECDDNQDEEKTNAISASTSVENQGADEQDHSGSDTSSVQSDYSIRSSTSESD